MVVTYVDEYGVYLNKGIQQAQKQKRNNELVYDEETYRQGQKQGKAEVERLDRIRGTDIKKILSKNKKALEWWTSI